MLGHLASVGLPDDQKTLSDVKELIAEGQRAPELDAECKQLRQQIAQLHSRMESRDEEQASAGPSTAAVQDSYFDAFRSAAARILETEFPLAIDAPGVAEICELTGFERAWERERRFSASNSLEEVRDMLEQDWFHAILRTEALIRTYCQKDVEVSSSGIRALASSLRLIAASHGFVVYPIRLLLPSLQPIAIDDEPISELRRIRPVRAFLSDIAGKTPNSDGLNLAIDCRRCRIIGDGLEIPAKRTPFGTQDWVS